MTGSGNPMFGKPNPNKGKTHKEMYSEETLQKITAMYIAKRKHTHPITWVNGSKTETCTLHELSAKYNISSKHLNDVVDPKSTRKNCGGWSISGVDSRNSYVRKQSTEAFKFFRLGLASPEVLSIDDMLIKYPELSYRNLRNIVNKYNTGDYNIKSYKGWMMEDTYVERLPLYTFHNSQREWVCRATGKTELASIKELSMLSGIDVGKLVEIVKGTRTSSKYKLKDSND